MTIGYSAFILTYHVTCVTNTPGNKLEGCWPRHTKHVQNNRLESVAGIFEATVPNSLPPGDS